ncbi:MAG: hypothetical protein KGJ06_02580 [Pseudomonadota bacterium]|nr:hypothetical protein [Pseudomonadota bacterium]
MATSDALSALVSAARLVAGGIVYRRAVSRIAITFLLLVTTGMLLVALLLSGCYAGYQIMIHHGVTEDNATLVVLAAIVVLTVASATLAIQAIQRLRDAMPVPPTHRVKRIAEAFLEGFAEDEEKEY